MAPEDRLVIAKVVDILEGHPMLRDDTTKYKLVERMVYDFLPQFLRAAVKVCSKSLYAEVKKRTVAGCSNEEGVWPCKAVKFHAYLETVTANRTKAENGKDTGKPYFEGKNFLCKMNKKPLPGSPEPSSKALQCRLDFPFGMQTSARSKKKFLAGNPQSEHHFSFEHEVDLFREQERAAITDEAKLAEWTDDAALNGGKENAHKGLLQVIERDQLIDDGHCICGKVWGHLGDLTPYKNKGGSECRQKLLGNLDCRRWTHDDTGFELFKVLI